VPSKCFHQLMMIITASEARLVPPELVSRVHLGDGQGDCGTMMNAMKSNLLGASRNVLEPIHQLVASSV